MSDLMREEFEQRFPVPRGVLWRDGAYHREKEKQCTLMAHLFYLGRWEAWRASRECLVIELPADAHLSRDGLDEHYLAGDMRDQIVESIHAAGFKTK